MNAWTRSHGGVLDSILFLKVELITLLLLCPLLPPLFRSSYSSPYKMTGPIVPHLMTLADLSVPQLKRLLAHSHYLKQVSLPWLEPQGSPKKSSKLRLPSQSLFNKTIALLFSKRSTRTRLASETSAVLLGGRALFLGREDIQLGVNETPRDTARVIGGMCQGIFARVGEHKEIEVRRFGVNSCFLT